MIRSHLLSNKSADTSIKNIIRFGAFSDALGN